MGLYGDKKDYEELLKENISTAKLLYGIPEEKRSLALELLKKREEVLAKNGLFATFELKKIDKKLDKLRS